MDFLITDKRLDRAEKIELGIAYLLQLSLVVATVFFFIRQNWLNMALSVGILILLLVPAIIRHSLKVHLPIEIDLFAIIFTYGSLFLGELHGYYTKFWWWDDVLHASSGLLFGAFGFLMAYLINEEKKIVQDMKPGFLALFAFSFAIMIGAIWEIFEFAMDQLFGFAMQHASLLDTMWDLIADSVTALFVSLLGYTYIKQKKSLFFKRLIRRFLERNPHLFKKRKLFAKIIKMRKTKWKKV